MAISREAGPASQLPELPEPPKRHLKSIDGDEQGNAEPRGELEMAPSYEVDRGKETEQEAGAAVDTPDANPLDAQIKDVQARMKNLRTYIRKNDSTDMNAERIELSDLLKNYRNLAEAKSKAEYITREGEANATKILAQGEENKRMMEVLDAEMEKVKNETPLEKDLREAKNMTDDEMREEAARVTKQQDEKRATAQRKATIEGNARMSSEHAAANEITHPTVEDLIREHNELSQKSEQLTDDERTRMETLKKAVAVFKEDRYLANTTEKRSMLDELELKIRTLQIEAQKAGEKKGFFGKVKSFFSRKKSPAIPVGSINLQIETLRHDANLLREELGFKTVGTHAKKQEIKAASKRNIPPIQREYEGVDLPVISHKGSGNKRTSASYATDTAYKQAAMKHRARMDERLNPPKDRKKTA